MIADHLAIEAHIMSVVGERSDADQSKLFASKHLGTGIRLGNKTTLASSPNKGGHRTDIFVIL